MAQRRWIRLDAAHGESQWLALIPGHAANCWPQLLCYVKLRGSGGRCKRHDHRVLAQLWRVDVADVTTMEQAALADEAIRYDGDDLVVVNWPKYQPLDTTNADRQKRYRDRKRRSSGRNGSNAVTPSRNTNSLSRATVTGTKTKQKTDPTAALRPAEFDEFWSIYPKRTGGNSKQRAVRTWNVRIREGIDPADIIAGLRRYIRFSEATGRIGTEFVKQAGTFLGPDRHWKEAYDLPPSRDERRRRPIDDYEYTPTKKGEFKWRK